MAIKKHCIRFLRRIPGDRFQYYYHLINRRINHNVWVKIVLSIMSVILFCIGFVLLFIPGPGTLFIFLSIVLFCLISKKVAVFFDRLEVRVRTWLKR